MRRKVMTTIALIILWSVLVIAVVLAEAFWFARPAVQPENLTAIETHLVRKLSQASDRELGSAALILIQDGKIATTHQFGIANAETKAPVTQIIEDWIDRLPKAENGDSDARGLANAALTSTPLPEIGRAHV